MNTVMKDYNSTVLKKSRESELEMLLVEVGWDFK